IDASPDGPPDGDAGGSPMCDPRDRFEGLVHIVELDGLVSASGFTLSADERTIYLSQKQSTQLNLGLYVATRPTKNAPFGPFTGLDKLNTLTDEWAPSLSDNQLDLYWTSSYGSIGDYTILRSHRAS